MEDFTAATKPTPDDHKILVIPVLAEMKKQLLESASYTMFQQQMQISDVQKIHSGFKCCDVARIKSGEDRSFGVDRLLKLNTGLDTYMRFFSIPSAKSFRHKDPRVMTLFRELEIAATALEESEPHIGPRSYPLARCMAVSTSLLCRQMISAISREPYFWQREALPVAEQMTLCKEMLERIKSPTAEVKRAIKKLSSAAEQLDELSYALLEEAETKAKKSVVPADVSRQLPIKVTDIWEPVDGIF